MNSLRFVSQILQLGTHLQHLLQQRNEGLVSTYIENSSYIFKVQYSSKVYVLNVPHIASTKKNLKVWSFIY